MTKPVILPYPRKRKSPLVTAPMAAKIKAMIKLGMMQHDIAAHFKINQGRVSEVANGKRFPNVAPVPVNKIFC